MSNFDKAVKLTLKHEGGYVNDVHDRGGETNFGVTAKVARGFGYNGAMIDLTEDEAKEIYKELYWDKLKLDSIKYYSVSQKLFDMGVNAGNSRSGKIAQMSINLLEEKGLKVDGIIGNNSIREINRFCKNSHFANIFLNTLKFYQSKHYIDIVERKPTQRKFLKGWLARV